MENQVRSEIDYLEYAFVVLRSNTSWKETYYRRRRNPNNNTSKFSYLPNSSKYQGMHNVYIYSMNRTRFYISFYAKRGQIFEGLLKFFSQIEIKNQNCM